MAWSMPPSSGGDQVQEFVSQALASKLAGGATASVYLRFVREFTVLRKKTEREPNVEAGHLMLARFITGLRDCVSVIRERHHDSIVGEVLNIRLWEAQEVVRTAVLNLISTLVVVNSAFTHTCLRLLVNCFLPPPDPIHSAVGAALGPWQPDPEQLRVQGCITGTLILVLTEVPTAPANLLQLIIGGMPHKVRDRHTQCMYLTALFAVAESPPARPIRDGLLAAAADHLLSLDVEIKWEDIVDVPQGEEEEVEGDVVACSEDADAEDIFQLEGMSALDLNLSAEQLEALRAERHAAALAAAAGQRGGWEGVGGAAAAAAVAATEQGAGVGGGVQMLGGVDEAASKLDSLMELTFAHLERRCQHSGEPVQVWSTMLAGFERSVLNTHRSKFSQFLLFYMCHKHPEPCTRFFVEFLIKRLQDDRQPGLTRSACAAYLASFLARCAAVPPTLVLAALQALTHWAVEYCATLPGETTLADAACLTTKHQVLYACMQAILYILCYHLETLLSHQHHHHHRQPIRDTVRELITARVLPLLAHPLKPLGVCLPSVVNEFRAQLGLHGLLVGLTPEMLSPLAALASLTARPSQRPLEMFFPFDPYLLKRSSVFLELSTSYVRWKRGHPRAAGRVTGVSESEGEEEGDAALLGRLDEDGDLQLDGDSSDAESSNSSSSSRNTEDDSLRGGSMPSESMLSRPKPGAHLKVAMAGRGSVGQPVPVRPPRPGAAQGWATTEGVQVWGKGGSRLAPSGQQYVGQKRGHSPYMGTSYDPMMGTSYGTGVHSSLGNGAQLMGTSPATGVVELYKQSISPMQP